MVVEQSGAGLTPLFFPKLEDPAHIPLVIFESLGLQVVLNRKGDAKTGLVQIEPLVDDVFIPDGHQWVVLGVQLDKLHDGKREDYGQYHDSKNSTGSCMDHISTLKVERWQSLTENIDTLADIFGEKLVIDF